MFSTSQSRWIEVDESQWLLRDQILLVRLRLAGEDDVAPMILQQRTRSALLRRAVRRGHGGAPKKRRA